ncbi:hypothetical protein BAUCODRAFT_77889 [Baudoinia panamericana UAMH 10762]|uniref:AMP-dependent synthetase/ligase domain-containing protein n=1 Tax=Baudoinia panamericana (strain UAMH 10762) TaxID=717646 RepID=M2MMF2_BAUPA|nr:uncharacterized protein BAUCODRAFT_77889 [Baudoinia panamericana UAMH 10762]EMC92553.1 hypothetical protein BAUCODRAFT_77889 [Baudoinia panamericana UAMH 10762]
MTECMPISTAPLSYRLKRNGTSGISVGPEIRIFDTSHQPHDSQEVGRICVRGAPVFAGYLTAENNMDKTCL